MEGLNSIFEEKKILTTSEACQVLGVSRPTLIKLAKEKKVGHIKIGSHYRFPLSALQKFIQRATITIDGEE